VSDSKSTEISSKVSDSKLTNPFSKVSDTLDTDRGRSLYLSEGSFVTKITLYRELNEAVQDQHFPAPAVFSGRAFHFSLRGCMNFSVASTESSTLAEAEAVQLLKVTMTPSLLKMAAHPASSSVIILQNLQWLVS
jgi:hypothetical protein